MKKEIDLSEMRINLRELWTTSYNKLPDWVDSENVIYKIENLINGKVYIGQAKWFYGRLVGNHWSHYESFNDYCYNDYRNSYLYNSIRKHHSKNYIVSIIDILETSDELNDKEIERIDEFNSFGANGYNMTSGGENCEHLHTLEVRNKIWYTVASQYNGDGGGQLHTKEAYDHNRENHGGILAFNTPESYETNRKNHGGILSIHTIEAKEKALKTKAKIYNGDPYGQLRTPEAWQHQRDNHGGLLAFHTPEARANAEKTFRDRYGEDDPYSFLHSPEVIKKSHETSAAKYNGDSMGQCRTEEAKAKSLKTRIERYGREHLMDQCHTDEAIKARIESNKRNHGGVLSWITDEGKFNAKVSRTITYITRTIDYIKKWHPELKDTMLTWDLYWYHCDIPTCSLKKSIKKIIDIYPSLKRHERWTPEMENIFNYLMDHKEEFTWLN